MPGTSTTTTPADPDLGSLLKSDHDRLDKIFGDLLIAFAADAREELRRLWSDLDASLTAHMLFEERFLLPAFARVHPAEAAALLDEHSELRKALLELGICVDLHVIREGLGKTFIARLRDHARREDGLLYRWASANHGPHDQDADLLGRLRSLVSGTR